KLYKKYKIKNLKDLEKVAKQGKIQKIEGLGPTVEQNILKTVFYAPRVQLKVRRKRRKRQKEKFRLSAKVKGREVKYDLPIEEHPTALVMFGLGPPGILVGHDGTDRTGQSYSFTPLSPRFYDALASGISFSLEFGNLYYFWRILAKIAHGYAVCTIGEDNFEPFLLNYIREESKENFYLIGGVPKKQPPIESLHRLELSHQVVGGVKYIVVRIRLFAFLNTPTYCVVVGKSITV
ncbi:MAG: hypothetical protein IH995_07420, partial [Proteobacteria bacterium]|nr:hypothetical protein [Pseudomonadota bacterium]